ncbi:gene transfer agent family protein [Sphingomonas sp.]|uniref:gene transfer agent family protein n=1 Tax=Sphingomonas sp. TaxID=28214 RepID=UPI003CC50987
MSAAASSTATANPYRGEASLRVAGEMLVLRPSFAALVAAEGELGPLFALVERAAEGRLELGETVALFWHCLRDRPAGLTREALGEAVAERGLSAATPVLRVVLQQILAGW